MVDRKAPNKAAETKKHSVIHFKQLKVNMPNEYENQGLQSLEMR